MRYVADVTLGELKSEFLPEAVPYSVLTPTGGESGPFPLCIVLHGGGGSRQSLIDTSKQFEEWWSDGTLPVLVLASPSAGMSYYLQDPASCIRWDSFIAEDLLEHLRKTCSVSEGRSSTVITGISMGGYGALKIAFAYPERFAGVAAMSPVLEPGLRDAQITARNRLHHGAGGPARLIGPERDQALFEANNPANRAIENAQPIREQNLAIYIETGDNDFINVHDGAEFLHRVLWDLDISHQYRLTRNADHAGPTLIPRTRDRYAWLGTVLKELAPAEAEQEQQGDNVTSPASNEMMHLLRRQMEPVRKQAAVSDPTTDRRYGVLPEPHF